MTWKTLLDSNRVRPHATSRREIDDLRALIARDIEDAALPGLSADRAFATAYNAALQSAKMAIACAGYRIAATQGHHQASFEAAGLAVGRRLTTLTAYFDACRRKRNVIDYDAAHTASDTEAAEIQAKAREFLREIETWIAKSHPSLAP
jgi:hypothetical protein